MKDTEIKTVGFGFLDALGILFIALKLLDKIAWPWVWVLAPVWIQLALFAIALAVILIAAFFRK